MPCPRRWSRRARRWAAGRGSRNQRSSASAPATASLASKPRSAEPMAAARSGMCWSASASAVAASPSPMGPSTGSGSFESRWKARVLPGDLELLVDRAQLGEERRRPVACDAADDDQPDIGLGRVDQVAVRIAGHARDDGDVRELGRLDRSERALPTEDLRGRDGHHLHELEIGQPEIWSSLRIRATLSSLSRFLLAVGAQSEPRATLTPSWTAAFTFVVPP